MYVYVNGYYYGPTGHCSGVVGKVRFAICWDLDMELRVRWGRSENGATARAKRICRELGLEFVRFLGSEDGMLGQHYVKCARFEVNGSRIQGVEDVHGEYKLTSL